MEQIKKHTYATGLIASIIVLALFLMLTNPDNVSIGLLVVPVVLLFFISFCAVQIFLGGLRILAKQPRRKRTVALVSASFITITAILQSTGGISGADALLLGLIVIVTSVYISKF